MWNLSTGSNVEKDQLFCSRYSQALKKFLTSVKSINLKKFMLFVINSFNMFNLNVLYLLENICHGRFRLGMNYFIALSISLNFQLNSPKFKQRLEFSCYGMD